MRKEDRRCATGGRSLFLRGSNGLAKDRDAEQERCGKDCKNRRYLGRGHLPFAERTDQANMTGTRGGRMERLVSDVVYGE
jgi:hypothetical protein